MEFSKALEAMKNGAAVKLPSWKGFWKLEDGRIKMHCKDGKILDFCETEDILYTLGNVLSNDWEILDKDAVKDIDLNVKTFSFGEALRNLKHGKKVARKGWNGKGMFLFLADEIHFFTEAELPKKDGEPYDMLSSIAMKTADDKCVVGWLASQTDMLADDWVLVE